MSIESLQDLYTKISSDARFRARLTADPDKVLSELDLTQEEKQAVRRVQSRLGINTRRRPTMGVTSLYPWLPEFELKTQ